MTDGLRWLTNTALLGCPHPPGFAVPKAQQDWVTINEVPMLVGDDPSNRLIVGCPMYGVGITPCTNTRQLMPDGLLGRGQSRLVSIDGEPACLETTQGITDGVPPLQLFDLKQGRTGQQFIRVAT